MTEIQPIGAPFADRFSVEPFPLVANTVHTPLETHSFLPGLRPAPEIVPAPQPLYESPAPVALAHTPTVEGIIFDESKQVWREKTGHDYLTVNDHMPPGMIGDFDRKAFDVTPQTVSADRTPRNIRETVSNVWNAAKDRVRGLMPHFDKKARVALSGVATLAALAACGGAVQPGFTPEVSMAQTPTTATLPTKEPTIAATLFVSPTPPASPSPEPLPRPSATPDFSIEPVKLEVGMSMVQELSKTESGKVFLARVDALAAALVSTRANVLDNFDVSQATDPSTNQSVYTYANVRPGGGFGGFSVTSGLDTGAFFGPDIKEFKSKPGDPSNTQYPVLLLDGKEFVVSTSFARTVAGDTVTKIVPSLFAREFTAVNANGVVLAKASMDIDASPIRNKEGKPLPDWKLVDANGAVINSSTGITSTAAVTKSTGIEQSTGITNTPPLSTTAEASIPLTDTTKTITTTVPPPTAESATPVTVTGHLSVTVTPPPDVLTSTEKLTSTVLTEIKRTEGDKETTYTFNPKESGGVGKVSMLNITFADGKTGRPDFTPKALDGFNKMTLSALVINQQLAKNGVLPKPEEMPALLAKLQEDITANKPIDLNMALAKAGTDTLSPNPTILQPKNGAIEIAVVDADNPPPGCTAIKVGESNDKTPYNVVVCTEGNMVYLGVDLSNIVPQYKANAGRTSAVTSAWLREISGSQMVLARMGDLTPEKTGKDDGGKTIGNTDDPLYEAADWAASLRSKVPSKEISHLFPSYETFDHFDQGKLVMEAAFKVE
ncbi:MAG: hypothetical protein WCO78_03025 [Candidatus Roizmanbacteria bacterium]